ncbi:uncharacterized protein IL334_005691 [Kwoniella shivajii]|uniref:Protein CPL1-like domain-containing protein n=1 Tax=Kwoniella shivajii TaxID=564305 RepID=A0ABZ1D3U4_9TREE|nr:hypothetical protein IL334_005691 [Kwoniella shivajii]
MLFPTFLLSLPLLGVVSGLAANSTLYSRTNGGSSSASKGSYQTCAEVKGSYGYFKYDFGCLCSDDVEEYCSDNRIGGSIQSAIKAYLSKNGKTNYYPANAQPTCDGRGGYTCGSLYKKSDGSCSSSACDNNHWTSNGSCCPRGQTYQNGRCCGSTGCKSSSGSCTPIYTCPSGQTFKTTKCCSTYQSETNGQCGCPSGYTDTGSACQLKCKDNEKYDDKTGKCATICDENNGYTHQKCKNSGPSICCSRGKTAYNTVCCSSGKEEIDKTGVCCTSGVNAKVVNGQCVEPTGKSSNPHARAARRAGVPIQLTLKESIPYGLEQNKNNELCPTRMSACPIEGRFTMETLDQVVKQGEYECINPLEDLQSCGGCSSLSTGVDCTSIPGAKFMGCNIGKCQIYSCKKGWKLNQDGSACERK